MRKYFAAGTIGFALRQGNMSALRKKYSRLVVGNTLHRR